MKINDYDFEANRLNTNTRSNSVMESIVRKGIELFLKEGQLIAVNFLRENCVPNNIIARVLYERDRVRRGDIRYRKNFKVKK